MASSEIRKIRLLGSREWSFRDKAKMNNKWYKQWLKFRKYLNQEFPGWYADMLEYPAKGAGLAFIRAHHKYDDISQDEEKEKKHDARQHSRAT